MKGRNVPAYVLSEGNQSLTLIIEIFMSTHILAINDDQAILDLYTLALEGEGYTVSTSLDDSVGKHSQTTINTTQGTYLIAMPQRRCTIAPKDAPIIIPRSFFPTAITASTS